MFKLVVFSCVLALAAAKPSAGVAYTYPGTYDYPVSALAAAPLAAKMVGPALYPGYSGYTGYTGPAAVATSYAAGPIAAPASYVGPIAAPAAIATSYAAGPIAAPAGIPASYAAYAPALPAVKYAAPALPAVKYAASPLAYAPAPAAIAVKPAVTYTAPQQIGTEIQKTVHVAPVPQVTGYSSTIMKPNLGLVDTPPFLAAQFPATAVGRKVQTIIPTETRVEPEVHVKSMPYDVPVPKPYPAAVERITPVVEGPTPIVQEKVPVPGAPILGQTRVAVHDVPTPVAAAPAVYSSYAAAPAIAAGPAYAAKFAAVPAAYNAIAAGPAYAAKFAAAPAAYNAIPAGPAYATKFATAPAAAPLFAPYQLI